MTLHQFNHWLHGPGGTFHAGVVLGALLLLIFICDRIKWLRG